MPDMFPAKNASIQKQGNACQMYVGVLISEYAILCTYLHTIMRAGAANHLTRLKKSCRIARRYLEKAQL